MTSKASQFAGNRVYGCLYWALTSITAFVLAVLCIANLPGGWWTSYAVGVSLFPDEKLQLTIFADGTGHWRVPENIYVQTPVGMCRLDPKTLELVRDYKSSAPTNLGKLSKETLSQVLGELPRQDSASLLGQMAAFLDDVVQRGTDAMWSPPFFHVGDDSYEAAKVGPPRWCIWTQEPGTRVGPGRQSIWMFLCSFFAMMALAAVIQRIALSRIDKKPIQTST